MTRLVVPFLDANIVDVTVTAWLKQPGDTVQAGERLAELTTDKAAFDLESPESGTLLAIHAQTKSVVPIAFILALIGAPGDSDPGIPAANEAILNAYRARVATAPARADAHPASRGPAAPPAATPTAPAPADAGGRTRATPKARRLAQAHGLDLADIQRRSGVELITEAVVEGMLKERQA